MDIGLHTRVVSYFIINSFIYKSQLKSQYYPDPQTKLCNHTIGSSYLHLNECLSSFIYSLILQQALLNIPAVCTTVVGGLGDRELLSTNLRLQEVCYLIGKKREIKRISVIQGAR